MDSLIDGTIAAHFPTLAGAAALLAITGCAWLVHRVVTRDRADI